MGKPCLGELVRGPLNGHKDVQRRALVAEDNENGSFSVILDNERTLVRNPDTVFLTTPRLNSLHLE